jgi:hypothetical protein
VILDKAQILGADDLKIETVPVPEWGGTVCVRNLRGWERDKHDEFVQEAQEKRDYTHSRARLVSVSLCDETGKSLDFTEADMLALSDKNAAPLDRLYKACVRLSYSGGDAKELEKNDSGQSENSGENLPTAGA